MRKYRLEIYGDDEQFLQCLQRIISRHDVETYLENNKTHQIIAYSDDTGLHTKEDAQ